jgi:hypothetical protein
MDDKNGFFSYHYPLKPGENKIVILLEDEAGRTMEKELIVTSDTISPSLHMSYPLPNAVITTKQVKITGFTDDPTALIQINGSVVIVEMNGTFTHELPLTQIGKVIVLAEATDPVGNYTKKELEFWFGYTIVLKIGSKTATNNNNQKQMNVAPLIQKGRTLVPFRFIGEQLGAAIDFTVDPTTKRVKTVSYKLDSIEIVLKIGEWQALVGGKTVVLEVAPQIISGSTVVPLRFVTEGLGCILEWEAVSQTITIKYPAIGY